MLRYDPAKRPSASECLQYDFFKVRVPIPLSAPTEATDEEVDQILDEADNDLKVQKQQSVFQKDFEQLQRQAILKEEFGQAGVKNKVSSLALLRKARYTPGVAFSNN